MFQRNKMVGKVLFSTGVVMLALANLGGAFPLEKNEEANAPIQNEEINHAKDSKNVMPAKLPCGHNYHLAHIVKDEVIIYVPQDVVKETFEKVNKTLEEIQKNYEKKKVENDEKSPFDEESIQHIVKIVPVGKPKQQEENNSKNQSKRDLKFEWSGPEQLRNSREVGVEDISKNLTQEKEKVSIPFFPEKLPCGHDYHLTHFITDQMFVYVPSNSVKETVKKINESLQEIKADYEKRKNEATESSPFDREVVQHAVQIIPIYAEQNENVEGLGEGQQSTRVQRLAEQMQATPTVEEPTPVISSKDEKESHAQDTLNTTDRLPCGHEYHIIHVVHDQMIVYVPPGILNETIVKVNKTLQEIQSESSKQIESEKDSDFDKEVVHHMVKVISVVPPHRHTATGEIIWDSQQKSEPEHLPTPVPEQQERHKRENNFHGNMFGVGYPQYPYHELGHHHSQGYSYQDVPDPGHQRSYTDNSYNDGGNQNLGGYNQRNYGFKPHFPI